MGDDSDWTDSFSAFDCPVDDVDDSPLPAPKPRAARLAEPGPTSTSAATPHQEPSAAASDGDESDLVATSNPFTKAAFNHAVRQARRPPSVAADPPKSKSIAGSIKSPAARTKTRSSTTATSKKPHPLRAAFAKQTLAKPPKITDPDPDSDPDAASRPSVVPGQDFFKKTTKPVYSIPKSAVRAKSSGQLKRKPLSPPLSTGLPKPRLQRPLPPLKPDVDKATEQHPSSVQEQQQAPAGPSLQQAPFLSFLRSVPSSPPQAANLNPVCEEAAVPSPPAYQPTFPCSASSTQRQVPSSPQTFPLSTIYEPAPASPVQFSQGPFTPYLQACAPIEDEAGLESIYASKPSFLDLNAPPSTPRQPIIQPQPSHAPQPAVDPLFHFSFPSSDDSPTKSWSTLKQPQVPSRPYARAEPQKTRYDLPPKGLRMLPGLVPASDNKTAKPHQGRLRAFDPPVPLSEWRAAELQKRSSSPVAFEESAQRRLPAVRLLHRKHRQC